MREREEPFKLSVSNQNLNSLISYAHTHTHKLKKNKCYVKLLMIKTPNLLGSIRSVRTTKITYNSLFSRCENHLNKIDIIKDKMIFAWILSNFLMNSYTCILIDRIDVVDDQYLNEMVFFYFFLLSNYWKNIFFRFFFFQMSKKFKQQIWWIILLLSENGSKWKTILRLLKLNCINFWIVNQLKFTKRRNNELALLHIDRFLNKTNKMKKN